MNELKSDNIIIQIRDKLQKDGVRLWQNPYYLTTGPSTEDLSRLAQDYSNILGLPYDSCYSTICELQAFALDKLKQRDLYRASGIATLRIKILNQNGPSNSINYETSLKQSGDDLKRGLSERVGVQQESLKLITNGKVLQEKRSLFEQGVQNGQQILALFLSESLTDIHQEENQYKEIEAVKADTQLLASEDNDYMELEDQAGNPVHIPAPERKALMIAMALHEKGRGALKREDYSRALVFFLDSDKEFSQCNSEVLSLVDNYALLDLDIAWCYLCLQSVNHLPEAYNRLKRCERVFEKSYGPNLERLIAVKGSPGNEAVLFLRLSLLQGIVLFHQNKRQEAFRLLKKVEDELKILKVDENSIIALMELGYSAAEARLGLRATRGDVNLAANYINENREKRTESRRKAMAERIIHREQKKLGKCVDGNQYVNPTFLKMLIDMGYNKEAARIGLQKCNNVISDSIQYIQENPGPSASHSTEVMSLINDLIPELEAAGFDQEMAKKALKKYGGDIMKAADELLSNNGIVDFDDDEDDETIKQKQKMKEEAFARLAQDISMVDDDHLDLTLQQEEQFLKEYMSLLNPI
ncbi:hypothetical protein RN001_002645 [Aquatica leii]|uniref:NEDD8 ultimate buster 1 n=1 Tax=Aquatica leii TaxID=1421715 RepID=A0AAN7PH64_9COLE|nr:hypothetical protein RN001_002645 [Aquatica leii]